MEWMARWDDVGGGRWVVGGVKLLVLLVLLVLWLFVLLLVLWEGGIIDVAGKKIKGIFGAFYTVDSCMHLQKNTLGRFR